MGPLSQDGRIGGHGACLNSQTHQQHIYKWKNPHRAPAEQWQGHGVLERTGKTPVQPDRMKEREKNRGNETGPAPVVGAEEETFPHLGKPPYEWGDQLGQRAASGAGRRAHQPACSRQVRVHRWSMPQSCVPKLGRVSPGADGGRVLESRVWRIA